MNFTTPERTASIFDYGSFGMTLEGRNWSVGSEYRFDFNGKETDSEDGLQDYGMRIYNKSLGKFLSVDPLTFKYPWWTPYQFAGNMPIKYIDLDGAEPAECGSENEEQCAPIQGAEYLGDFAWVYMNDDWARIIDLDPVEVNAYTKNEAWIAAAAVAIGAVTQESIVGLDALLEGTGVVRAASGRAMGVSPWALIATMPLVLKGDNITTDDRRKSQQRIILGYLEDEELTDLRDYINDHNNRYKKGSHYHNDRIVFRYMSFEEFKNNIYRSGDENFYLNKDPQGKFSEKYITPDFYMTSGIAKSYLALPNYPDIVIWTYENLILTTKLPPGPGIYNKVDPNYGEIGGGNEATINQVFPVIGFFIIY